MIIGIDLNILKKVNEQGWLKYLIGVTIASKVNEQDWLKYLSGVTIANVVLDLNRS